MPAAKFDGKAYDTSGGLHGVGASVVNALSEWMEVEVAREKHAWKLRFERGHAIGKLKDMGAVNRRGTIVSFKPDDQDLRRHRFLARPACTAWPSPRPICSAACRFTGSCDPSLITDDTPAAGCAALPRRPVGLSCAGEIGKAHHRHNPHVPLAAGLQ